ncbi:MAG: YitT family protein [[Clostridium] scindens]
MAVGGSLMFALGVNLIIIPLGLYGNGGFMGIAQLMRTFVVSVLHVPVPSGVDPSPVSYTLSVIFLCSICGTGRYWGRNSRSRRLITVGMQSMFLVVVPIPAVPLIEDLSRQPALTGGIIAGTGTRAWARGSESSEADRAGYKGSAALKESNVRRSKRAGDGEYT